MSDTNPQSSNFTTLNSDVTSTILSLLPIPSLVRLSSVSKHFRSLITSLPHPPPSPSSTWLFLFGIHNTSSLHNQSFAFDPLSSTWLRLPFPSSSPLPSLHLAGSHRFLFSTAPRFSFSPILKPNWRLTSPIRFPRINPLLAVLSSTSSNLLILVVGGGAGSVGGLVDIDDRSSPVQIYDSDLDAWRICPPLPDSFRSKTLSSALCGRRFYVFDINSCFVSFFSLDTYTWSDVQTLRPPGLLFAVLNSCDDTLVLGGMCDSSDRGFSFNLWRVEEGSMEFSEIAIMPEELLFWLVGEEEEEEEDGNRFRSLKCVGAGNLVYVFNEDGHKKYPACVCEIGLENGEKCRWRSVPSLPCPVNKFHKLVSFCSTVSVSDVFHSDETQIGA